MRKKRHSARNETFYTTPKRYEGNLMPLVSSGGTPALQFRIVSSSTYNVTNGILDLHRQWRFCFSRI